MGELSNESFSRKSADHVADYLLTTLSYGSREPRLAHPKETNSPVRNTFPAIFFCVSHRLSLVLMRDGGTVPN